MRRKEREQRGYNLILRKKGFGGNRFPGFKQCMKMMRQHDPQVQEDGFYWLKCHANEYLDQLIAELNVEEKPGLRGWLLELIGEARSPLAFPLLVEYLHGTDEMLRDWAVFGLKNLDSKEARRILWEAGLKDA
ncbi:MAG: HEAT repeat domain-containing protein [Chloroflexota bacterium]|nr:HEAT repeat domain-containing protein [Chloroflexota bacterium]